MIAARTPERPVQVPLWKALIALDRPVTIPELAAATAIGSGSIDQRLNLWVAAGVVTKQPGRPGRFTLAPDALRTAEPPMIDRQGRATPRPPAAYERVWGAIRVRKTFDIPELLLTASVSPRITNNYLGLLQRAGYVRLLTSGNQHSAPPRYRLIRNTGRHAPKETIRLRDGGRVRLLIDPNTHVEHDVSAGTPSQRRKYRATADGGVCPGFARAAEDGAGGLRRSDADRERHADLGRGQGTL